MIKRKKKVILMMMRMVLMIPHPTGKLSHIDRNFITGVNFLITPKSGISNFEYFHKDMAMMIVVMLYNLIRPLQTLRHPEARDSKNFQLTVCPKEGTFNIILKETLVK